MDPDSDFSAAEWLALFPPPLPPLPLADGDALLGASGDPGAEERAARPLTADALLKTLPEPLRSAVGFAIFVRWTPRETAVQCAVGAVLGAALLGLAASWNDGTFGAAQVAAGFACAQLYMVNGMLTFVVTYLLAPKNRRGPAYDWSSAAPVARWLLLEKSSRLLHHDAADALCPCPARSCAGSLPFWAGVAAVLHGTALFVLGSGGTIMICYTTLVTFGGRLWSTWWGCLLGVAFVLVWALYGIAAFARSATTFYVPILDLELRLRHRAATVAGRLLLDHYRAILPRGEGNITRKRSSAAPALLARLHERLLRILLLRHKQDNATTARIFLLLQGPATLVTLLVNVGVGSCVLVWNLVGQFVFVGFLSLVNLAHLAARNAQTASLASLYAEIRRELASLACAFSECDDPSGELQSIAARIAHQERLVASFAGFERYEARFMGFLVTWGALRTVVATMLTLAFAVWGVLRGMGVLLTLESFCPTR